MKEIIKVNYNLFFTSDHGEEFSTYELGKTYVVEQGEVKLIEEHEPRGEGDKWFYDVHFVGGNIERIFSPCNVFYKTT